MFAPQIRSLALLGTWVGTVLAFYFARENIQAATESTLRFAGLETATPVARVMIRESDFVAYDLPGLRPSPTRRVVVVGSVLAPAGGMTMPELVV